MHKTFKMFAIAMISATGTLMTTAFAAPNKTTSQEENIDVSQERVSLEEIATVYNLSKLCPSLVKDKAQFEKAYQVELKKVLPNETKPKNYVQNLAKQADFQQKLKDVQASTAKFSDKENTEMCQEIADYRY